MPPPDVAAVARVGVPQEQRLQGCQVLGGGEQGFFIADREPLLARKLQPCRPGTAPADVTSTPRRPRASLGTCATCGRAKAHRHPAATDLPHPQAHARVLQQEATLAIPSDAPGRGRALAPAPGRRHAMAHR